MENLEVIIKSECESENLGDIELLLNSKILSKEENKIMQEIRNSIMAGRKLHYTDYIEANDVNIINGKELTELVLKSVNRLKDEAEIVLENNLNVFAKLSEINTLIEKNDSIASIGDDLRSKLLLFKR